MVSVMSKLPANYRSSFVYARMHASGGGPSAASSLLPSSGIKAKVDATSNILLDVPPKRAGPNAVFAEIAFEYAEFVPFPIDADIHGAVRRM